MDKKLAASILLASLLFFTISATAQEDLTDQTFGDVGGSAGGFVGSAIDATLNAMDAVTGQQLDITEIDEGLAFGAALGVIWFVIYLVLEVGLDRLGILEAIRGRAPVGEEASNRRIQLISTLIVLMMFGSGLLIPLVAAMINYTVYTVIAFFAGAGAYIWTTGLIRGRGQFKSGVKGARADVKRDTAEVKQDFADAAEREKEAEQMLQDAKSREEKLEQLDEQLGAALRQGDLDRAETTLEEIVVKLNNLEKEFEGIEQDTEGILKDLQETGKISVKDSAEIKKELNQSQKDIFSVGTDLAKISNQFSVGGGATKQDIKSHLGKDLKALHTGLEEVHDALQAEKQAYKILHEDQDQMNELERIRQEMDNELGFLEDSYSDLDAKAQDLAQSIRDRDGYEELQQEIEAQNSIEDRFRKLLRKWKNVDQQITEAEDQLEELENAESEHLKIIDKIGKGLDQIKKELENESGQILKDAGATRIVNQMDKEVTKIRNEISTLEKRLG